MTEYIESIYKLAGKERLPTSRICTICGKMEYPQSDKATTMTWLCPECAKKIGKLIGVRADDEELISGTAKEMLDWLKQEATND